MSSPEMDNATPGGSSAQKKHVNPFTKAILLIFAVPYIAITDSARYLRKKAYDPHDLVQPLGVIFALAAGIGAGYVTGWSWEWSTAKWVLGGVASALATYFYLWPLIFLGVVEKLDELADKLWTTIDRDDRRSWFSGLLMFVGYAGIIVGCAYLGWNVMGTAHDKLAGHWHWLGIFAWPGAIVAGGIIGLAAGAALWALLYWTRMRGIAIVTGAGLVYVFSHTTAAFVERYIPGSLTAYAVHGGVWTAYALQFVVYMAYVFPAVHILFTHGLGWLADLWEEVLELAYDESDEKYRKFFSQAVNIYAAYHLFTLSFLVWPLLGITLGAHYTLGAAALIAFLSYVVIGKVIAKTGPGFALVGVAAGLHMAAYLGFGYYARHLWFGVYGAVGCGVLAAVATFFVAYPLAYACARLLAKPLLASWLGNTLAAIHEFVYNGVDRVVSELGHAYDNTYSDTTQHREVFLHLFNLAVAVGVFFGMRFVTDALGFAAWLVWGVTGLSVVLSYVLVGKGLIEAGQKRAGNHIVGTLVGLTLGVFAGSYAYASVAFGFWMALAVAVLVGLVAAALAYGLAFPIVYVSLKGVCRLVREEKWLRPVLVTAHDRAWGKCANLWQQFKDTCQSVRDAVEPTLKSIRESWESTKRSVRETWDEITKRNR